MTRRRAAVIVVALAIAAPALPAHAALREVSVGNYYFQDDASGNRAQVVVDRGDQIRFTVREAGFSPHDVRVDELGIRTGDMQLFETFTTEPLDVPGTFRLYCNRHKDPPNSHVAQLVVRDRTSASTTPPTTVRATSTTRPAVPGAVTSTTRPSATTTSAVAAPPPGGPAAAAQAGSPPATVASGFGQATDRRRPPPAEGSLADILGRRPDPGPWTRALTLAAAAWVAMMGAVAFAILRGRRVGS